eukprot:TRINITY_DN16226_c0_g1_i1.p1 TRINITY_DN16226_c0_g1~~TRINITY_DN16226_c0_g1_i1.p1  ORF type:complete len:256 (+),score=28.26 TRINITY_DN16226_c0_g1_i1:94-861(+)
MGIGGSKESETTAVEKSKQIFILSGQSNMAGRGGVKNKKWDGVVPPECQPNPSILRFTAKLQWEEARDPLHADIDLKKTCGVGPSMAFANAIRALDSNSDGVICLVPCAVGGTAIREWERGTHLYENMVRRAKESVKGGGEIRAVLWYQGESDTSSSNAADSYKHNMEKLIGDIRADLQSPSLPIIQVAIASGDEPLMEKVREAQLGIKLPNVACVDAKGLQLKEDHLHLTTEAQVQLGNMLADAFLNQFATPCP